MDKDFLEYMEMVGWTVTCESPLEIDFDNGLMTGIGEAAQMVVNGLWDDYQKQKFPANDNI